MQLAEHPTTSISNTYSFSQPFPVARYRFVFSVNRCLVLPGYAGSAIRGVFGHALKKTSCITGLKNCNECGLKKTCPYTGLFKLDARQEYRSGMNAAATNPYIIEAPLCGKREYKQGERFEFDLVLAGPVVSQLALCVHAMRQAFYKGIGPANGTAELQQVIEQNSAETIWSADQPEVLKHSTVMQPAKGMGTMKRGCTVEVQTPLRLAAKGKLLSAGDLGATEFLTAVVRRVASLVEGNMNQTLDADFRELRKKTHEIESSTELRWREWERYSNRQKQAMSAGGLVGTIELRGDLEPFLPFLKIASFVHVGKMTSFGNGKIQIGTR